MGGSNVSAFTTHHSVVFKISVRILSSGVVQNGKERSSMRQSEAAQCLSVLISLLDFTSDSCELRALLPFA